MAMQDEAVVLSMAVYVGETIQREGLSVVMVD
jgi:hypothetical protein